MSSHLSVAYVCFEVALNLFLNQLNQIFFEQFYFASKISSLIKLKFVPDQEKLLVILDLKEYF